MKLKSMVTEKMIYSIGENPVYGENSISLKLTDEAAGPFFIISQSTSAGHCELRLEVGEIERIAVEARAMYNHFRAEVEDE